MSSTAIDLATKLIALSSSSHEEEARTAAFQACKIIRENKLVVMTEKATEENRLLDELSKIKRDPGLPLVHLTGDERRGACGVSLISGINYYWTDKIATLNNCCIECVRRLVDR